MPPRTTQRPRILGRRPVLRPRPPAHGVGRAKQRDRVGAGRGRDMRGAGVGPDEEPVRRTSSALSPNVRRPTRFSTSPPASAATCILALAVRRAARQRDREAARAASRSSRPSRRAAIACNGTSDTDAGRPAACRRGSPAIRPATRRSARRAGSSPMPGATTRTPARCRSRGERQRADHRMRGFVVIDRDPVQHHPREPRHAVRIDEADPLAAREPAVEARPVGAQRTRDRSDATSTARRAAARGNPRVARRRSRAARPDCARARLRCRETPACRSALQASGPSANGRAASSAAHRRYGARGNEDGSGRAAEENRATAGVSGWLNKAGNVQDFAAAGATGRIGRAVSLMRPRSRGAARQAHPCAGGVRGALRYPRRYEAMVMITGAAAAAAG